jgi:hypothetical protein
MARITYSGLVTSINGSVGGTTFQNNAFGNTVKNKPVMARFNSELQRFNRRNLNTCVQAWGALTDSQRLAWNAWATAHPIYSKHNPSAVITGYQYFIAYNLRRLIWVTNLSNAPGPTYPTLPTFTPQLAVVAGVLRFKFSTAAPTNLIAGSVFASAPQKPTNAFVKSRTRKTLFLTINNTDVNCEVGFLDSFGVIPVVGDKVFLHVQVWGGSPDLFWPDQDFIVTVTSGF